VVGIGILPAYQTSLESHQNGGRVPQQWRWHWDYPFGNQKVDASQLSLEKMSMEEDECGLVVFTKL